MVESTVRKAPVVAVQPSADVASLTTQDEFEVGLLLHHRQEAHLMKECPLCLHGWSRDAERRKYVSAVNEIDMLTDHTEQVTAALSYLLHDVNAALSYLPNEELFAIFPQ